MRTSARRMLWLAGALTLLAVGLVVVPLVVLGEDATSVARTEVECRSTDEDCDTAAAIRAVGLCATAGVDRAEVTLVILDETGAEITRQTVVRAC